MVYNNILEVIGNTPIVKINNINPNKEVHIFAKLEGFNPSGSVKDRIALRMIDQAEESGQLTKDKTILEPTSGNTGISIAMIGAIKKYNVEIIMSKRVSIERAKIIKAFGAKVHFTPKKMGTDGAILFAEKLMKKYPEKYIMLNQYSNPANISAHYHTTAQEIIEQTNGHLDYFVSSIGTSGTLMGVAKALKEYNPSIQIIAAQPKKGQHIDGMKNMEMSIVPALYDQSLIDRTIMVNFENAYNTTAQLIRREGLFVGISSGAAMFAAQRIARSINSANIVVLFPDRGEKYLSIMNQIVCKGMHCKKCTIKK